MMYCSAASLSTQANETFFSRAIFSSVLCTSGGSVTDMRGLAGFRPVFLGVAIDRPDLRVCTTLHQPDAAHSAMSTIIRILEGKWYEFRKIFSPIPKRGVIPIGSGGSEQICSDNSPNASDLSGLVSERYFLVNS